MAAPAPSMLVAALVAAMSLAQSRPAAPAQPVRAPQVSARVTPESPAIGEPVTVTLRVRAPAGSEVRFPALPDSAEAIEPLDPRAVSDASTGSLVDRTATYRLIAWDTGQRVLRFGDVTVSADGVDRRYRVDLPPLRVRSVLPADSTGRVPRPGRPPLEVGGFWWKLWLGLAVALLVAYWLWRGWRARGERLGPEAPDAAEVARARFASAEALGLLEAGEHGRHALVHVGVMRDYVAARFPQAQRSLTPREVADALAGAEFPVLPERVVDLLLRAEPIAFAQAPVSADEAREMATEARAIVHDVETALEARRLAAPRRPARPIGPARLLRRKA
jgi:hypothetical protein